MTVQHISAVTLAVGDMARSVEFYRSLGLSLLYGGGDASFTSFRVGECYLNLVLSPSSPIQWWGRLILQVEDVDAFHQRLLEPGLEPDAPPRDAEWGERYFHLRDPDGHELSFAQPLAGPS